MREIQYHETIAPADYVNFVVGSQREDFSQNPEWPEYIAKLIHNEAVEFEMQHGNGFMVLIPELAQYAPDLVPPEELKHKMADELGDLVWFVTLAAHLSGKDIMQLADESFQRLGDCERISTFQELQTAAIEHADNFKVPTKIGLLGFDLPEEARMRSLRENPQYVFMRTEMRLARALEAGRYDCAPPTASELEPLTDVDKALGDFMVAAAYVAANNLGWSIEDVLRYNAHKLTFRERFGKSVPVP